MNIFSINANLLEMVKRLGCCVVRDDNKVGEELKDDFKIEGIRKANECNEYGEGKMLETR